MQKTKVFIAYAREDEAFLHRLREYLAPLERNDAIETWYDGKIAAGEQWDEKIKTHLHAADLILLLVSAKSLASNYFYNEEMKDALSRHERKEAIVVPVILKHCGWRMTDLKDLQALPKDGKPITAWSDESAAYNSVLEGIYESVQNIQQRRIAEKNRKEEEAQKLREAEERNRRQKERQQQRERKKIEEEKRKRKEREARQQRQSTRTQSNIPDSKAISQNEYSINFGKILRIALPTFIGIAAIFGIGNWINNRPIATIQPSTKTSDNTEKDPQAIQDLINDMVRVQGGDFTMGSNDGGSDEQPPHTVTLSSYNIGKYEVTQAQWQAVMGSNPSYFKDCGSRCPVEQVSWNDVQEFIKKLNRMTKKTFRLPTEAEWEYAARGGGQKTLYSGTSSESSLYRYANFCDSNCEYSWKDSSQNDNYSNIAPVGRFSPNPLGLYDMSGNVWEWCQDWYAEYSSQQQNPKGPSTGTYRVFRGGSWDRYAGYCRVCNRNGSTPDDRGSIIGFRLISPVY